MGRACPPRRLGRNAGPQPHSLRSRGPVRDTRLSSCRGPPGCAGPLGDVSQPPWAGWGPSCRHCPHYRGLWGSRSPDAPASVQACSLRPESSAVLPGPPSLLALLCWAPPEHSARSGTGHPNPLPHLGPNPPRHLLPLSVLGGLPSPCTVPGKRSAGLPGVELGTENRKDKATGAPRLTTAVKDSCPDSITTRGLQAQALHIAM